MKMLRIVVCSKWLMQGDQGVKEYSAVRDYRNKICAIWIAMVAEAIYSVIGNGLNLLGLEDCFVESVLYSFAE